MELEGPLGKLSLAAAAGMELSLAGSAVLVGLFVESVATSLDVCFETRLRERREGRDVPV